MADNNDEETAERACSCGDSAVTCAACGTEEAECALCLGSDCDECGAEFCEKCVDTECFTCLAEAEPWCTVKRVCAGCLPSVLKRGRDPKFYIDGESVGRIINCPTLAAALRGRRTSKRK